MNRITICGCSDESVDILIEKFENKNEEDIKEMVSTLKLQPDIEKGLHNIICNPFNKVNEYGKNLIEKCVDFLLYTENIKYWPKKNIEKNEIHKNKYITLWSFIYN